MTDLEKAKAKLQNGGYTCVLVQGGAVYTSNYRGVRPLLEWLETEEDFQGFSAADKVVGKATAYLYVKLGVQAVYAGIISQSALAVLQSRNIQVEHGAVVPHIINRKGDGICPFEEAVLAVQDADAAYTVIRQKMREMTSGKGEK